jgi:hypothetical protein
LENGESVILSHSELVKLVLRRIELGDSVILSHSELVKLVLRRRELGESRHFVAFVKLVLEMLY